MTQLQNILIKNPLAVMTGLRGPRALPAFEPVHAAVGEDRCKVRHGRVAAPLPLSRPLQHRDR